MSMIKRTLCTLLAVTVVLIGLAGAAKTQSADAAEIGSKAVESAAETDSGYVCAPLALYAWAHDENAQPQELLATVLREKALDEDMEALILASFDQLTQNYDTAYTVLRSSGVPDLHTVQMHYVYSIAHIKEFDTFSGDTYTYHDEPIEIGGSCGFFYSKYDLMCVRETCMTPTKETCDLFLHETMHAYQDVYLDSEYNQRSRSGLQTGMQFILIEGDAQLYNTASCGYIESMAPTAYCFQDEYGTSLIQKGRTCDKKYNMVYKLNTVLQHLLGYDTVQLMRYQPDMKQEEAFLSQQYGINGEAFLHACALLGLTEFTGMDWTEKNGKAVQSETSVKQELLAYVDRVFVQCLAQEISGIDSADRQTLKDFYHFYRFYKLQYQPEVRVTVNGTDKTITDTFFDNAAVEDTLYQKIEAAGLSGFPRIGTNASSVVAEALTITSF